jgi:hypothetical protein
MLEYEKQRRYISCHTDAATADGVVPFNVHASKFISGHIVFNAMEFLEDTGEVVEVFQAHIFNAKVVYDETELDGSPFVTPETGC